MGVPLEVVVVGDGLVGLFAADAIRRRRLGVTVVAAPRPGMATDAAAGMLSWRSGNPWPGPAFELARRSNDRWCEWIPRLGGPEALAVRRGTWIVGDPPAMGEWDAERTWQTPERGFAPVAILDGAALAAAGGPSDAVGRALGGEDALDPRRARAALAAHCRAAGIRFVEAPVEGFAVERGRAAGVICAGGVRIAAGHVVVAAGAWTTALAGLEGDRPVTPVRGQMLVLEGGRPPPHVVHLSGGRYLVPRPDGRVLVGSTDEAVGFDPTTTEAALDALHRAAVAGWPGLAPARRVDAWAGLRPVSPDGAPVVGPAKATPGLVWATGHGRSGVLLAPITGEVVADWIESGATDPDAATWTPARLGL